MTAPRSPTTTGKIERFHRSLRTEFLTGRIFESKASAQAEIDAWITRRVGANGIVSIAWQQISVGKHRSGANVDVHIQMEMVQIWDGSELIKSALRNKPGEVIREKNASILKTQ